MLKKSCVQVMTTFKTGLVFIVAKTKKKVLRIDKIYFYIFILDWYDFIPMVRFPLGLQHACNMPAACLQRTQGNFSSFIG